MAALKVDDLDRNAKHALVVVCCRAHRLTASVSVSAARVSADMKVARNTASAALGRAVESGYLSVDRHPGKTSLWRLDLSKLELAPAQQLDATPAQQLDATEDSLEKYRRKGAHAPNGQVNGRPAPRFAAELPPNPWVYDEATGFAVRRPT